MFGNNCSQSYKTKKKLMLTICRKQETNCSLILCWPIQPNFPPRLQTLSLYNVNLLPLCSGPVQVFTRKTNICVTHPSADRTTAEELATWPGLSNPSRTCLSLSFAFPLPDTRDEVTSRGMTEIWCSGMFIPAEPTGGAHTHTSCPTAGAKSMMVWTTTPCPQCPAEVTQRTASGLATRRQIQIQCENRPRIAAPEGGWNTMKVYSEN